MLDNWTGWWDKLPLWWARHGTGVIDISCRKEDLDHTALYNGQRTPPPCTPLSPSRRACSVAGFCLRLSKQERVRRSFVPRAIQLFNATKKGRSVIDLRVNKTLGMTGMIVLMIYLGYEQEWACSVCLESGQRIWKSTYSSNESVCKQQKTTLCDTCIVHWTAFCYL